MKEGRKQGMDLLFPEEKNVIKLNTFVFNVIYVVNIDKIVPALAKIIHESKVTLFSLLYSYIFFNSKEHIPITLKIFKIISPCNLLPKATFR